jgi:hypothetical protein
VSSTAGEQIDTMHIDASRSTAWGTWSWMLLAMFLATACPAPTGGPVRSGNRIVALKEWPPPAASARSVLPNGIFASCATLGAAADLLTQALDSGGYSEKAWYAAPGGFALVTRVERVDEEDRPLTVDRWSLAFHKPDLFSFAGLKDLFVGSEGRFRMLLFIVTSEVVEPGPPVPANKEVDFINGPDSLPEEIRALSFTKNHHCLVLVYEYRKKNATAPLELVPAGENTAIGHLKKTSVFDTLSHS